MDINKSINFYMAKHEMIQADLSRNCSLSSGAISLIRNNHRAPSFPTLIILANMFKVKLSEFIAAGE